jgi:hypothetical protein
MVGMTMADGSALMMQLQLVLGSLSVMDIMHSPPEIWALVL